MVSLAGAAKRRDTNVDRLLFSATFIMSALHCWRSRGEYSSKPDPNMQVDSRV
jgi:hypothetical protein